MIPSPTIRKFLADGTKPASDRERTALLDECRALFGEVAAGKRNITTASGVMNCVSSGIPTAKHAAAKPATVTKPAATASKPAPKQSATPLLDKFNSLSGEHRTAFFRANRTALRAEQAKR